MQTTSTARPAERTTPRGRPWHTPDPELAIARARHAGRIVIVRQVAEIKRLSRDPIALPPVPNAGPGLRWADRDGISSLAAVGCVQRSRGGDLGLLTEVSLHGLELNCAPESLRGVPFLVGGAAFMAPGDRHGAWSGWPDAALWVPRWVVARRGTRCVKVSHLVVCPSDRPAMLAQRMAAERRRLDDWLTDERVPEQGGWPWAATDSADDTAQEFEELQADWCSRVLAARRAIRDGRLEKVVLARAAIARPTAGRRLAPLETLVALQRHNPQAFSFLLHNERGAVFVGATPEMLARKQGERLETEALAGTAARSAESNEDARLAAALCASPKEQQEHAIVVERVVEALDALGATVARDAEPQIVRLPRVQHLRTRIQARLPSVVGLLDAVAALHPTPAVGGSPKQAARDWQSHHEQLDRGWYGGPIGWLDAEGNGVFAVAIRSALILPRRALLFAGAGIVADSDPQREWAETELKLGAVRDALQDQATGDT